MLNSCYICGGEKRMNALHVKGIFLTGYLLVKIWLLHLVVYI